MPFPSQILVQQNRQRDRIEAALTNPIYDEFIHRTKKWFPASDDVNEGRFDIKKHKNDLSHFWGSYGKENIATGQTLAITTIIFEFSNWSYRANQETQPTWI